MLQEAIVFRQVWSASEKVEKIITVRSLQFIQTTNKMKKEEREKTKLF